jgi:hypothetical protein
MVDAFPLTLPAADDAVYARDAYTRLVDPAADPAEVPSSASTIPNNRLDRLKHSNRLDLLIRCAISFSNLVFCLVWLLQSQLRASADDNHLRPSTPWTQIENAPRRCSAPADLAGNIAYAPSAETDAGLHESTPEGLGGEGVGSNGGVLDWRHDPCSKGCLGVALALLRRLWFPVRLGIRLCRCI